MSEPQRRAGGPRILVAGMGNVLHGDDGFGIRVLEQLALEPLPGRVTLLEAGIAGINLVQHLFDGYDMLLLVDASRRQKEPGDLFLLEPDVPDLSAADADERRAILADTHVTLPARAFALARALGVLPPRVYILGCEPQSVGLGIGLSPAVELSVPRAVAQVRDLIAGQVHPAHSIQTGATPTTSRGSRREIGERS